MTCAAPASSSACFLALVRVVAIGVAPTMRAIWMAARPTLLEAAGMMTKSPEVRPPMSMSAP